MLPGSMPHVDYEEVRGMEHTRESELEIAGKKIKIAVVHTLKSAMEMLERVKNGTADYQFIEVMACPGGCPCQAENQSFLPADF